MFFYYKETTLRDSQKIENNTVESVVCDPPYGLKFMEKGWDSIGDGADQREWHQSMANRSISCS